MEGSTYEVGVSKVQVSSALFNLGSKGGSVDNNFSKTLSSNQAKLTASSAQSVAPNYTQNTEPSLKTSASHSTALSVQDTLSLLEALNLPLETTSVKQDAKSLLLQEQLKSAKDLLQNLNPPQPLAANLNLDLKYSQDNENLNLKQNTLSTLLALKAQHGKASLNDGAQTLNLKSVEPNLNPLPQTTCEVKGFKLNLKRLKKAPKRKNFKGHWLDFSKQNLEFEDKLCPI